MIEQERLRAAFERLDAANREDPNRQEYEGRDYPKELLYAQRMTSWLDRLAPEASEAARLAARAQHICRWKIPRGDYPMDRTGYRRWRSDLGRLHAETAGQILRQVGYEEQIIGHVQAMLRKERLKADPDCQLLEDVICLVFLEYHLHEFAQNHDDPKLINILRRTWQKMSPRGQDAARQLELPPSLAALLDKALES